MVLLVLLVLLVLSMLSDLSVCVLAPKKSFASEECFDRLERESF